MSEAFKDAQVWQVLLQVLSSSFFIMSARRGPVEQVSSFPNLSRVPWGFAPMAWKQCGEFDIGSDSGVLCCSLRDDRHSKSPSVECL